MVNRRDMLRVSAVGAAALVLGESWSSFVRAAQAEQKVPSVLTPEEEEGPFYIEAERIRRDITEDRPGVPLDLRLAIVHAATGQPLTDAAVDIWHCDAGGLYSGFTRSRLGPPPGAHGFPGGPPPGSFPPNFAAGPGHPPSGGPPPHFAGGPHPGHGPGPRHAPTDHLTFLRGVQITDNRGQVAFTTIYPGWYAGREIHIHVKVHVEGAETRSVYKGGHVCHTGQLFFPDETNLVISRTQPYASSKTPRTTKETDQVYRGQQGDKSVVTIRPNPTEGSRGYLAQITLAVDPAASPKAFGPGGGPPPRTI